MRCGCKSLVIERLRDVVALLRSAPDKVDEYTAEHALGDNYRAAVELGVHRGIVEHAALDLERVIDVYMTPEQPQ